MVYFYHCYRGAHLSITAAALHLGKITVRSGVKELLALQYFDILQPEDMGTPVLAGYDRDNNPVYFVGLGRGGKIFARFADSLVRQLGLDIQYKSVDCLPCLNIFTRVGGFLARFRGIGVLGRRLAAWGVAKNLDRLHSLVLQAQGR